MPEVVLIEITRTSYRVYIDGLAIGQVHRLGARTAGTVRWTADGIPIVFRTRQAAADAVVRQHLAQVEAECNGAEEL